ATKQRSRSSEVVDLGGGDLTANSEISAAATLHRSRRLRSRRQRSCRRRRTRRSRRRRFAGNSGS
ncbi:unnamed protein product, partial [Linum tenue]